MKSKQLAIMIALVAILGGAAWYLNKSKNTWTDTGGATAGKKIIELPINDVAQLVIQSPSGTLNLVKKDELWAVQERADYPANFEKVSNLLRKFWDLKTVQEVKVGPSQFARLELAEPGQPGAGTKIEFKDKDGKAIGALVLGKKFMKKSDMGFPDMEGFPAGRYIVASGGSNVSLVSETLDDADPKPENWLQRDFFKVENPSAITLAGTTDAQNWKLTRENATAEWKLEGAKENEKADPAKTSGLGFVLTNPTFADVMAPDAKPADTGLDKPAVVTVETFDHFIYVLKVGKVTGENHPVTIEVSAKLAKERTPGKDEKPEDKTKLDEDFKATLKKLEEKLAAEKKVEGRVYLIAKATLDQVIKDRSALLPDKAPEPAPGTPSAGLPFPGTPAPALPPGTPPAVVTPPIAVPPVPKPPADPTKPKNKPIEAVTPPVSVPPADKPGTTPPGTPPSSPKPTDPAKPPRKPVSATTPPVTVPPVTKPDPKKPAAPAGQPPKSGPAGTQPKPPAPSGEPPKSPPAKPGESAAPPKPANG